MSKNTIKTLYTLIACLIFVSCQKKSSYDTSKYYSKKLSNETIQLIEKTKSLESTNLNLFIDSAKELSKSKDTIAQLIGDYYQAKGRIYDQTSPENISSLKQYYERFKKLELSEFLLDIDLLLYKSYYDTGQLKNASEQLSNTYTYIFEPRFELERNSITLGEGKVYDENSAQDKVVEIESFLKNRPKDEWNIYIANIYLGLAQAEYILKNKGRSDELYDLVAERSIENKLYTTAAKAYHRKTFRTEITADRIKNATKAVELIEQSGHKHLREVYYRVLGLVEMEKNEYGAAFEAHQNAVKLSTWHKDTAAMATDMAYMGWAKFNENPSENAQEALDIFDQSIAYSGKRGLPYKMGIERKMWVLETSNANPAELINTRIELAEYLIDQDEHEDTKYSDFFSINLLRFKDKNNVIHTLDLKTEEQQNRLEKTKLLKLFSFISVLFLITSILMLKKKAALLNINKEKREKLNDALESLKDQNEIILNQNLELESNKLSIKNELKSKLKLIESIAHSVQQISDVIKNNPEISPKAKHQMLNMLDLKETERIVEDIDFQFVDLNKEFCNELTKLHPDLTSNNLKLCVYLKMNLSSKEIASLTYTTVEAVKVARSRLRQKLGLKESQNTLGAYLNSI